MRMPARKVLVAAVAALGSASGLIVSSAPAAVAGPSTSVCAEVSGCKKVLTRDVDGDGRGDQVGIVERNITSGNGSVTVLVRTYRGKRLQITNHGVSWFGRAWHGAAAIDGHRGAELVVGQFVGAHMMQFRVITVRKGKLVWLWAPKPPKGGSTGVSRKNWLIDSSYSFDAGVYRSVKRGVVTLQVKSASRYTSDVSSNPRYHVTIARYTWRSGKWQKKSYSTVTRRAATAAAVGGWHVKGLPRFPRW